MHITHENRYRLLLNLNELNKLVEDLSTNIVGADDWLFLSADQCAQEVCSCVEAASRCAAKARGTLKELEVQIRQTERSMKRID